MSDNMRKQKITGGDASGGDEAAVDELLRAAQDDVLLNLRLNSHSTSSDSHFSSLDSDLTRRFDALKSKPSVPSSTGSDADDLESRFAKLKGGVGPDHGTGSVGGGEVSDGGTEAEVEKVIQWAMDAARLDQSSGKSTGEEDEGGKIDNSESSDDEEEDDEDGNAKGKGNGKAKGEKRKWFFQL